MHRLVAEGAPMKPAERLADTVANAADEDVAGMRPLELAQRWNTDARQTLEVFVRATVAGLVELRWELLCPRCRGAKATASHLRDLANGGYCPTCNLHFFASVDESIEARFYPNPSIRKIEVGTYCVGSPMKTPHRLAQAELAPGESRTWSVALEGGVYVVSSPQSDGLVRLLVKDQSSASSAQIRIGADATNAEICVRPGRVHMYVSNQCKATISVALDDTRWSELGATPGRLMTLPAFRAFLSREALAPGFELAIGRVGLLFTDLAGSTALYERIGDARAFKLVGEHFTLLWGPIERNGGAIVKTIGDAVMAAFPDGRSAMAAGVDMQRAIRSLETNGVVDAARLIKVGVHVGACYAVTLNERLDYFGTTVNLAARAQNEALGGEIVATQAALEEGLAELECQGLGWEGFDVELKGFSAPVRLFRIDVAKI
jgi:class 3 adenylate cyclase